VGKAQRAHADPAKNSPILKCHAAIAGGGVNVFSRYENGKTRSVAAVVNLCRLLDKHPELIDELTV